MGSCRSILLTTERFKRFGFGQNLQADYLINSNEYLKEKHLSAGYILGLSQQRKRNCELLGLAFEASQTPLEKFLLEYLTKRAANDLGAAKIPTLVKAFTNWADAHPEKWSSPVGAIVTKGDLDSAHFLDAWPCKLDKD